MVAPIWISQVILAYFTAVSANELLPERYLKPQDFNHHPFTDVGVPASLKRISTHPYAILAKKRPREGREFPPQKVIYYPTPHPSTISRKHLDTNEIGVFDDPYSNVPKNYAFSYQVRDQHSGDDFSHSQAHNGKATRGQYRVKLPDGRTQVVSYTADHKGYRADVQYENDLSSKPYYQGGPHPSATPAKLPELLPSTYQNYNSGFRQNQVGNSSPELAYNVPSPTTATPVEYDIANSVFKSTVGPEYYPPLNNPTTPSPYHQDRYVSTANQGQYVPQHYGSSTPLYPVGHAPTTAAPPAYQQENQIYHHGSSTFSPQQVYVTPRPSYNRGIIGEHEQQEISALLYSIL